MTPIQPNSVKTHWVPAAFQDNRNTTRWKLAGFGSDWSIFENVYLKVFEMVDDKAADEGWRWPLKTENGLFLPSIKMTYVLILTSIKTVDGRIIMLVTIFVMLMKFWIRNRSKTLTKTVSNIRHQHRFNQNIDYFRSQSATLAHSWYTINFRRRSILTLVAAKIFKTNRLKSNLYCLGLVKRVTFGRLADSTTIWTLYKPFSDKESKSFTTKVLSSSYI